MHCHQININKSSRTARPYNPMLPLDCIYTHFSSFSGLVSPSQMSKMWLYSQSQSRYSPGTHQKLDRIVCATCAYAFRISCWVWIRVLESLLSLDEGHAPPQTINQWALELRGYTAHIPCLLQGNKDALFPAQKYTNTAGPDVLYSNRIQ